MISFEPPSFSRSLTGPTGNSYAPSAGGMITFGRNVTIKSRGSGTACYARAHSCLGETFDGSLYGSFFFSTQ